MAPASQEEHDQMVDSLPPLDLRIDLGDMAIDAAQAVIVDRCIRIENHSLVYSVRVEGNEDISLILEARVFRIAGIALKLRRHRLRCIARLDASRGIAKESWGSFVVVVYLKGPAQGRPDDGASIHTGGEAHQPSPTKRDTQKAPQKTPHQREAARIRQMNRRRAKRSKKREQKSQGSDPVDEEPEMHLKAEDEKVFKMALLLYLAVDNKGRYRPRIPAQAFVLLDHIAGLAELPSTVALFVESEAEFHEVPYHPEEFLRLKRIQRDVLNQFEDSVCDMPKPYLAAGVKWALDRLIKEIEEDTDILCLRQTHTFLVKTTSIPFRVVQHSRKVVPSLTWEAYKKYRAARQEKEMAYQNRKAEYRREGRTMVFIIFASTAAVWVVFGLLKLAFYMRWSLGKHREFID